MRCALSELRRGGKQHLKILLPPNYFQKTTLSDLL
jgi:hypothetical protein